MAIGQMNVYGETVEFYLVNDMGTGTRLYSLNVLETNTTTPEDEYEYWLCSYKSEKKFVATVERTTFFNVGDKITFKRQ